MKSVLADMPIQQYEDNGTADPHTIMNWMKGESGLEQKKRPGNLLSRYERRKELTCTEPLPYEIELRELLKKRHR